MEKYTRIGDKLKEFGCTKRWLAKKVGKTEQTIGLITNGKSVPSLPLLYDIAKVLRISVFDLLIEHPEADKKELS